MLFKILTISFPLFFFQTTDPKWKTYQLNGFAQGTTWRITYYAKDSLISEVELKNTFEHIDSCLSIYKPYSSISQWNRSVNGMVIDEHFQEVVKRSKKIYSKTKGAFDITVFPLMQAWGFGPEKVNSLPDSAKINSILSCVDSEKIKLEGNMLFKTDPCVKLDVNGIAQGYTVDLIAKLLEQNGISNYLVELGGEIRIKGRKQPSGQKMAIAIETPNENEFASASAKKIIYFDEGAVTTSGSYHKFYTSGGKKIAHLLDPRSGYPLSNELISVTLWARDAITADGYDNSLMVMGLKNALDFMKEHNEMEAYFIYQKADGSIGDTATVGFSKLFWK